MKKTSESIEKFKKGDSGPKYLFRGPHCEWGVIILRPNEQMGAHGHKSVVEDFYFIEGNPKVMVANTEFKANPGDAVRAEPGETHNIVNDTDKSIKLVFIKSPYLPDDKYSI
ncbi:MAG: cupin domain-containing protein [Candidatus Omnitrophica bacterium]|nr:cupin domain-containing protein [Candidatus Omnitrophota bacterium]MCM8822664.1 cupin domain-containing protein [Candidatus Omnitrophota bacterium]MCM8827839.1 cupin domain-containing protein [Candidatus Omnitrophota bacterium]